MELGDDDLEIVEPPQSRRLRDSMRAQARVGAVEDDVAGECLAEIAAETARASWSSHPTAPARPGSSRLPVVRPPPFVRRQTQPSVTRLRPSFVDLAPSSTRPAPSESLNGSPITFAPVPLRERTSPAFARRSVETIGVTAAPRNPASVAPVALPTVPPGVIVVRDRPAMPWLVASAAVGALCAVVATRVLEPTDTETTAVMPVTAATIAPPPPAPSPAPSGAVVRFSDAQGVVVAPAVAPPPVVAKNADGAPPAPPAAKKDGAPPLAVAAKKDDVKAPPAKRGESALRTVAPLPRPKPPPSSWLLPPKLPDGSYGLSGTADSPPRPAVPKAVSVEQRLAEEQLKSTLR